MRQEKKKTMWSVKFHDFQKHNITWDTMLWRCREDVISRRTAWFARIRIMQKKHTLSLNMMISIVWYMIWTVSTVMILNMKSFPPPPSPKITVNFSIFRKIDAKKYLKTNFMFTMRYYYCKIQYLSPTYQNVLPSDIVTSISFSKSEDESTQEMDQYIITEFHWMKS